MATSIRLDGSRGSTIYRLCEENGSAKKSVSHRVEYLEELVRTLRISEEVLRAENKRLKERLRDLEWTCCETRGQQYLP